MSSHRSLGSPLFWLVPTLALALGGLYWLETERTPVQHAPPTVASPDEDVAGFAARVEVDGGALRVRLTPLHPDATRQRFDASALARRLGLGAGEPWRLTLAFDATPGAPGADGPLDVEVSKLAVLDGEGALVALSPLEPGARAGDRPSDPLRVLLGATRGTLAPGASLDVVLWGCRPSEGARLVGLEAFGGAASAPLEHALHRRAELEAPLARLDRPASSSGKSAEPRASEAARR